jgi:two-component system chemotaxis response regulator CheB
VIKLLIVDDSALARKLLGAIFAAEADFDIRFARNGAEALEAVHQDKPDVVTLDLHMPVMDGLACLDRIMIEQPCPVVMVSTATAEGAQATIEALRRGAVDFIPKPKGALSLATNALHEALVAKVRQASTARLRNSLNLRERVRHRLGGAMAGGEGRSSLPRQDRRAGPGQGVVLVGTSTGGPAALEALLAPLPAQLAWPIVVAQHMPAAFTGPLAHRLNQLCALTVEEVVIFAALQPGHVYIAHGDADIVVGWQGDGLVARSVPAERDYPWHPSVDLLVRSAMGAVEPHKIVGVLMTGMGDDGAAAMAALRAAGGRTIAEAEDSAVVWGMPGELARAGGADFIVPLPGIAERLVALLV